MSMNNIISFVLALNGVSPSKLKFSWLGDQDTFDVCWESHIGATEFNVGFNIDESEIKLFTEDEIRAVYKK